MTTTTNELPGVWTLHLTSFAGDEDDHAEYTLGAYVTLDLAKERVRQLLAMQGSDLLVWRPNAIPNLRSPDANIGHPTLRKSFRKLLRGGR